MKICSSRAHDFLCRRIFGCEQPHVAQLGKGISITGKGGGLNDLFQPKIMKLKVVFFVFAMAFPACAQKFQFQDVPLSNAPALPNITVPQTPLGTATNTEVNAQKPSDTKVLISPEQARQIIKNFKEAYLKFGSPRILIYASRDTADDSTAKTSGKKKPVGTDSNPVQDVENIFARLLRDSNSDMKLADQTVASRMMPGKILKAPNQAGDAKAAKDRDSLRKIADVAIEVLIFSRSVIVKDASGDKPVSVPDIQATAIRLEDAHIIGQALLGDRGREFELRDMSEAVALSLMEDMVREAK